MICSSVYKLRSQNSQHISSSNNWEVMEDGNSDWSVYYAGFVRKKNVLGIFFNRYAVLDDTTLVFYEDETESDEKERFLLSPNWTIEPITGFDFRLSDSSKSSHSLLLSTDNFEHLESWLLALTQSIMGPYRESENFCTGAENNARVSSDHQLFDCHFNSDCVVDSDFCNVDFVLESCLLKQDASILFTKSWRKVWCRLKNNGLLEYCDNEDFSNKMSVLLNDQSRVIRLPDNFQGQRGHGLSLLTTETKKDTLKNLRLCTDDEALLYRWANFMNYCIDCYNRERFSLLSTARDSTELTLSRFVQPFHMTSSDSFSTDSVDSSIISKGFTGTSISSQSSSSSKKSKKPTTAYYVNDDTARARIQRFLAPSRQHKSDNASLQAVYWEHFCTAVPDSPYVIVEVFEHQRFGLLPRRGFNALNLFFTDPSKLASHAGVKFPDRYLKRAAPPAGYDRWVTEAEVSGVVRSPHPVLALIYSPDGWSTHPSYPAEDIDEQGWTYGTSFEHLRRRCGEGQSRATPNATDVVRRRRWLRVATNFVESSIIESIFTNLGAA